MDLHKKQLQLLRLLSENTESPLTIRKLQALLDLSSPSLVHHHIKQLEKKKYISRNPNNPKDYKILNDPKKLFSYVNLYGLARCGPDGTLLSGDPIDRIPLSPKMISFNIEDAFLVEALGNSMEPYIHEGDFVIAKMQNCAENGEIVVCSLDGEVMIKKLYKDKKLLISINPKIDPIVIGQKVFFNIDGVVKGIICNHIQD